MIPSKTWRHKNRNFFPTLVQLFIFIFYIYKSSPFHKIKFLISTKIESNWTSSTLQRNNKKKTWHDHQNQSTIIEDTDTKQSLTMMMVTENYTQTTAKSPPCHHAQWRFLPVALICTYPVWSSTIIFRKGRNKRDSEIRHRNGKMCVLNWFL